MFFIEIVLKVSVIFPWLFSFNNPKRKKMYVTLSPCKMCAKAIINADIKEVYYIQEYRDDAGIKLLQNYGIKVCKI
jgi:dCMP deaminase